MLSGSFIPPFVLAVVDGSQGSKMKTGKEVDVGLPLNYGIDQLQCNALFSQPSKRMGTFCKSLRELK